MWYEWSEAKRRSNIQKHGIDFIEIESLFAVTTVTALDDRFDHGEPRFTTLGLLNGRVVVVAHTETKKVIRIVSVRKATKNERTIYFRKISERLETRRQADGQANRFFRYTGIDT